jgi:peptidylprolyl isomerase
MFTKKSLTSLTAIALILSGGSPLLADPAFPASAIKDSNESAKGNSNDEIQQSDILRISEAFGHFIGRNLNNPGLKFDLESIIKGMREGAANKPAPMSDQEYEQMMTKLQERAFSQLSEENLKAANAFLEKNAKAQGVVVVEPGKLEYKILEEGKGPAVTEHSAPQIQYTGKYIDGTVFGSSEEAGGPITIPLDQTIPGFSKGIVGMKEGEKRRLFVHPDLGYGTTGHLPPNSLLIFDIEVVKATTPDVSKGDEELLPLALETDLDDGYIDEDDDLDSNLPRDPIVKPDNIPPSGKNNFKY